ncbi:MAG: S9 family peptidase [Acidobacteriaceae bacterium]|nr:S9 family peptidase [Acidobacteriaceae bacterium]
MRRNFCGTLVFALITLCAQLLSAAKKPVTIEAVLHSRPVREGETIVWSPQGSQFIVNRSGTLSLYDVPSGKSRDVIALRKLEDAAEQPVKPPVFDWMNRRVVENEIQWFADGKRLLISASGDLFIVDIGRGAFEQLTKTAEEERDPKLSPDNKYVSFRRGHDLCTLELSSKRITTLTRNGSDTLLNGELDWVYPEEPDLATAYWWSPDSRYIAYMQFDIAHEPVFPQVSLLKEHATFEPERFPQPGDPNADVRIGVVSANGGETRWMNFGEPRGNLIARVAWLASSRELAIEQLPRTQNKIDVLIANVETGASRTFLHEEDPYWINIKGDLYFLNDNRLLWTSERSGFRHIYLYRADGALERQLTSGDWEIDEISAIDEEHHRIFFTSTEASPLERQLYVVSFDGSGKRRLTTAAGTHHISLSPPATYYIDTFSSLAAPPREALHTSDGAQLRLYREANTSEADEYQILRTEIVKLKAADGTLLYGRLIKPPGFRANTKYPAIVMVYGGPGVQAVRDSWQGVSWDQVLAQHGFVVWQLDNRGSSGRGHKFESAIYHNLGGHELEDQKTGIQYLISQGFVDAHRIGLYGWSYGGFMTLYTVTHAPELIKAAISGAPVTDWHNYDSIYTERYMGLPATNQQAYEVSSPVTSAGNLASKLLLVHNIEDDNVHFQNTMQMAEALEKAGKQFDMVIYPQKTHHVDSPFRRQLLEETTEFFDQNLKP